MERDEENEQGEGERQMERGRWREGDAEAGMKIRAD